jgi:murein DD-endopeptidase MepM/ murein hydrolase activator NlpD
VTTAREARKRREHRRELRAFSAGAIFGLLVGALLGSTLVWQFADKVAIRAGRSPAAVDVGDHPMDDAGGAVLERADERPAATSGTPAPPTDSAKSAVLAPEPASGGELEERDLVIPVEGVQPESLTRQFSEQRGSRMHEAIDILAPRNTPVRAVEDGTIARLFHSKAGGITIYQFDPTERFCYYYAHLERYADGLGEGDRVRKGQTIGYVGTSGNAPEDTPHLHFAIFRLTDQKRWWEGTPIDPYDVLR